MQVSRASLLCFCALMVLLIASGVPGGDQPRPGVSFTVSPAATGLQVVRVSLPLPPGFLGSNQLCSATAAGSQAEPAALRVLSWHSAANTTSRTARRALVTFPHRFANTNPVAFMLQPAKPSQAAPGGLPRNPGCGRGFVHPGMEERPQAGAEVHRAAKAKDNQELCRLYRKPGDRDATRDYREGAVSFGSAPPEGIVYSEEVLGYYLQHRAVARLLAEPKPDEPLGLILARSPKRKP